VVNTTVAAPIPVSMDASADLSVSRIPLHGNDIPVILATVAQLARQFSSAPIIRQAAEEIIHPARNADAAGNAYKLAAWVRNRMIYVPDPTDLEYVQSPVVLVARIISKGQAYGDCDDHVLLLASLLGSLGISNRILGVKLNHDYYDHVINSVQYCNGGEWHDIDTCAKTGVEMPFYRERIVA